jgi:hypothetical protein
VIDPAAAAVASAAAALSRAGTAADVCLQVVLGRGNLGVDLANFDSWDGRSRLYVVEAKGQAFAAGVSVGDELLELNGKPVKPDTHRYELKQHVLDARTENPALIVLLFRVEASAAARLRALAPTSTAEEAMAAHALLLANTASSSAASPSSSSGLTVGGGGATGGGSGVGGPSTTTSGAGGSNALVATSDKDNKQSSSSSSSRSRESPYSLERLISHVMEELRLPSAGQAVEVNLGLGNHRIK